MSRIASISRKFESGVGFSNGCAELTLKKPPPFVPSCLMAICEAAGPSAIDLLGDGLAVRRRGWLDERPACRRRRRSATTPCETRTSASTSESGRRT